MRSSAGERSDGGAARIKALPFPAYICPRLGLEIIIFPCGGSCSCRRGTATTTLVECRGDFGGTPQNLRWRAAPLPALVSGKKHLLLDEHVPTNFVWKCGATKRSQKRERILRKGEWRDMPQTLSLLSPCGVAVHYFVGFVAHLGNIVYLCTKNRTIWYMAHSL